MIKLLTIILVISISLTLLACARPAEVAVSEMTSDSGEKVEAGIPSEEPRPPTVIQTADLGESWATDRMIVYSADMNVSVADTKVALEQITNLAENLGGYVVSSRVWYERNVLQGSISFRVPQTEFNNALDSVSQLAVEVMSQSTTSQDVTEEYVDLNSKLTNLTATEKQLQLIMQEATTVEETLAVQKELTKVRGDIEETTGRMQYLERSSSTSLIQVYLNQSALNAELIVEKTIAKVGEKIYFSAEAVGGFTPYNYEWDFGDKTTSLRKSIQHAYQSSGDYTVKLKVTDGKGNTFEEIKENYITVQSAWDPANIARNASHGLVIFGQALINIFIFLGIWSPVWLIGGGIPFYIWYRRRKKRAEAK